MKLECVLKRPKGTIVTLGDETYRFLPDDKEAHVCVVTNKEHRDRLLSEDMNGSYIVHGAVAAAQVKAANAKSIWDAQKEAAKVAADEMKVAQADAEKALKEANAEEKRLADQVAMEEERERQRAETNANAQLRLKQERQAKADEQKIVDKMKENSDMNEDDAKKSVAKDKATAKVNAR